MFIHLKNNNLIVTIIKTFQLDCTESIISNKLKITKNNFK